MKGIFKRNILISLIAILLGKAVFVGINPIAIGYFASVYIDKASRFWIFICTIIGMALSISPDNTVKYGMVLVAFCVVVHLIEKNNKEITVYPAACISGIVTVVLTLTQGAMTSSYKDYVIMAILEGIIIFSLVCIFRKGIVYSLTAKAKQPIENEELISISIIAALLAYTIPNIPGINFSVMDTGIFLIVIILGYKYGAGAGAIGGAACGIVLALRENTIGIDLFTQSRFLNEAGMFCVLGIFVGVIRNAGKFITTILYGLCGAVLLYLYQGMFWNIDKISALSSALVMFLFMPKSWISIVNTASDYDNNEQFVKENLQSIAKLKLKEFSESFQKLATTFDSISDTKESLTKTDVTNIFEELSDRLCKNCQNCQMCWETKYYDTYSEAYAMLSSAEKNGAILEQDIPKSFLGKCCYANEFLYETNKSFQLAKINLNWHNRMAESREAIAGQFMEVSNIIKDFSKDLYGSVEIKDDREKAIVKVFASKGIDVSKVMILERQDKKQEVYATVKMRKGHCITSREAAMWISDIFGKRMKPSDAAKNVIPKSYETIVFEEDANFKILTGIARVAKENEKISGDNFSFIYPSNGEMIMLLSDGMGTGVKACEESESVIELLEQFVEAGFREESAIKLINSILVLKSEKQSFSTIDMSILDLFTGMCRFVKIGASTTFIKRDEWVETISSTTLPVGVFNQVDFDGVTKKLYDGDFVIMVSDGVLDCIGYNEEEKYLEKLIMEVNSNNPKEIASYILESATEKNNNIAMDDMTVLVAGIWKR